MKKVFGWIGKIVILLAAMSLLFSCSQKNTGNSEQPTIDSSSSSEDRPAEDLPAEEQKVMLFLGDSIGEAIAGCTPLTEREAYGYYGIIGNINGYSYYNRAVSGHTTEDLLNLVRRGDDGINLVETLTSTADVIHISIIGNDFLNSNHSRMLLQVANNDFDDIAARQEIAKSNILATLRLLRENNENATIILQTLYNPAGEDSPLFTSYAREQLAAIGIQPSGYHDLMEKLIGKLNEVLTECIEEVSEENGETAAPFFLIDVHGVFENIYREDRTRWERLFCADGIHTHPEGHALIAGVIQDKLDALSLTSADALIRYRKEKTEQLDRLFYDLPDRATVRDNILRASDLSAVTKAYFDGTEGAVPSYREIPTVQGETFSADKVFPITLVKAFGQDVTSLINEKRGYIRFGANGEYELYVPLQSIVLTGMRYMMESEGGFDVDSFYSVEFFSVYFPDIAPGVDKRDLPTLIKKIKDLYGMEIVGIDEEKPCVQAVFERYRTQGKIIFDDPDILGDTLALRCTGTYRLQEVTSPLTDETYTAIYVNNAIGKGEAFFRYTYLSEEDGFESVRMTIDVIKAEVEGYHYAEE